MRASHNRLTSAAWEPSRDTSRIPSAHSARHARAYSEARVLTEQEPRLGPHTFQYQQIRSIDCMLRARAFTTSTNIVRFRWHAPPSRMQFPFDAPSSRRIRCDDGPRYTVGLRPLDPRTFSMPVGMFGIAPRDPRSMTGVKNDRFGQMGTACIERILRRHSSNTLSQ